jgi:hypothetical protein
MTARPVSCPPPQHGTPDKVPALSRVLSARGSRPVILPPVRSLAAGACSAKAFVPAAFFWGEA